MPRISRSTPRRSGEPRVRERRVQISVEPLPQIVRVRAHRRVIDDLGCSARLLAASSGSVASDVLERLERARRSRCAPGCRGSFAIAIEDALELADELVEDLLVDELRQPPRAALVNPHADQHALALELPRGRTRRACRSGLARARPTAARRAARRCRALTGTASNALRRLPPSAVAQRIRRRPRAAASRAPRRDPA